MSLLLCSVCNPMPSGSEKVMCQWPKNKLCFLTAESLPSYFLSLLTNPQSKLQSVSPSEWFLKAQRGSDIFQMTIFLSWPFCCPFWWVIAFFEIFICELCHLQASWWWKTLLRGVKVMEISSVTLTVCFSPNFFFSPRIFCSALVRGIIQGESAVEKKRYALHMNTPLKYQPERDKVNRT